MSYNIDNWTTKEMHDFRIALAALEPVEDYLDEPTIDLQTNVVTFTGRAEGFELQGTIEGEWLIVSKLESYGEASGTMHEWFTEQMLPQSTGYFRAVLVWERGDSITRLIVDDGKVTDEAIEVE